jgi:hypothetical protein
MKAKVWLAVAAAGLVAGACVVRWPDSARASEQKQRDPVYDSAPVTYNNPEVKCLPYVKVSNKVPRQVRLLVRSQQKQGCIACHQSNNPKAGRGDHPKVKAATAHVVNALNQPMEYETKSSGDTDWRSITLQPGQSYPHTYDYKEKFTYKSKTKKQRKQHRSPEVLVRFTVNGKRQAPQRLTLVATPNRKLGNVYYFQKEQQKVALYSPPKKMKLHR